MKILFLILLLATNFVLGRSFASESGDKLQVTAGVLVDVFNEYVVIRNEKSELEFKADKLKKFNLLLNELLYQKVITTEKMSLNTDGNDELVIETLYFPDQEVLLHLDGIKINAAQNRDGNSFSEYRY